MKNLFTELRSAVMVTLIFAVVCCGLYPLVVFGISQALFRDQANGSLMAQSFSASSSPLINISSHAPQRRATATTPPVPVAATSARPRQTWP
jgi:K+-transporting ATPase c subunit